MSDEEYLTLKRSGLYTKQANELIRLHEIYLKIIYLDSFDDIAAERKRLRTLIPKT